MYRPRLKKYDRKVLNIRNCTKKYDLGKVRNDLHGGIAVLFLDIPVNFIKAYCYLIGDVNRDQTVDNVVYLKCAKNSNSHPRITRKKFLFLKVYDRC